MSPLIIIGLMFVGFLVLYIVFRLGAKAVLRSYYEEKNRQQHLEKGEKGYGKKV